MLEQRGLPLRQTESLHAIRPAPSPGAHSARRGSDRRAFDFLRLGQRLQRQPKQFSNPGCRRPQLKITLRRLDPAIRRFGVVEGVIPPGL